MNTDQVSYYRHRAREYENIYSKPERQADLKKAAQYLKSLLTDCNVLEVACGTGYWTERIASAARSITASDINEEVLEIAKSKDYREGKVNFEIKDLYEIKPDSNFNAVFAAFIVSHIPLQNLRHFFSHMNRLVNTEGRIVVMDNTYVEASNLPLTKSDEFGNTYQTRTLKDGTQHLILKNFLTEDVLNAQLKGIVKEIQFIQLDYYWILNYIPVSSEE